MVICVGDDDVLLHAKAKSMRRVELTFVRPELAKLAANLHRGQLLIARASVTKVAVAPHAVGLDDAVASSP